MEKEIPYDKRVLIGNWFETSRLQEDNLNTFIARMKKGNSMLTRFRKTRENLMTITELTQSPTTIWFGAKIALKAPLVPATTPTDPEKLGVLLSGCISANELDHIQELSDQCRVAAVGDSRPAQRNTFVISSVDQCNREGELLKYNQDFALVLASSVDTKPLYVRYDPIAVPAVPERFPVFLSEFPITNIRWRVLPTQKANITRFEQEGQPVHVNQDIVINHSATNVNLAVNSDHWIRGFFGMECSILVKNILDVYKLEMPGNIWHMHTTIPEKDE